MMKLHANPEAKACPYHCEGTLEGYVYRDAEGQPVVTCYVCGREHVVPESWARNPLPRGARAVPPPPQGHSYPPRYRRVVLEVLKPGDTILWTKEELQGSRWDTTRRMALSMAGFPDWTPVGFEQAMRDLAIQGKLVAVETDKARGFHRPLLGDVGPESWAGSAGHRSVPPRRPDPPERFYKPGDDPRTSPYLENPPTVAERLLDKAVRPCMTKAEAHNAAKSVERSLRNVERRANVSPKAKKAILGLLWQARETDSPRVRIKTLQQADHLTKQLHARGAAARSMKTPRSLADEKDPRLGHLFHGRDWRPAANPDTNLRELERAAAQGDAHARRALAFARIRSGNRTWSDDIWAMDPAALARAAQANITRKEEDVRRRRLGGGSGYEAEVMRAARSLGVLNQEWTERDEDAKRCLSLIWRTARSGDYIEDLEDYDCWLPLDSGTRWHRRQEHEKALAIRERWRARTARRRAGKNPPMEAWDVFETQDHHHPMDTVFYVAGTDPWYVRHDLVFHDGYPPSIVVRPGR